MADDDEASDNDEDVVITAAVPWAAWDESDAPESIDEVITALWPNASERSADNPIGCTNVGMVCGTDNGMGCDNPPALWALYLMKYTSGLLGWVSGTLGMLFVNSSIDSGFLTST